jgi:exosortase
MSAKILDWTEVPVFQDGNILKLSNYILEVKQACSGSRSNFALAALALLLGFGLERKWWIRVLLLAAAPILAILANVIRIVGTGLIASRFGNIAADEMLHTVWGVLVFTIAVIGLFAFQRFLLWVTTE